jgi:dethiobiotin synthetase
MVSYFVTSTGTDIGKTYVTAGILRAARRSGRAASAVKPLLTGYSPDNAASSDSAVLLAAMGKTVSRQNIETISPWRFTAPLSPDMAAAREGRRVDFALLTRFCQVAIGAAPGTLLIEGVGGVAVPLDESRLVSDWISALRIPAILVAGTYLGSLSHTINAVDFLAFRGITVAAVVLSESETPAISLEETAATLHRFVKPPLHMIPRGLNEQPLRHLAESLLDLTYAGPS